MSSLIKYPVARKLLYYIGVVCQVGGPLLSIEYRDNGLLAWTIALGGFFVGTAILLATGGFAGVNRQ
jgi:hypothetical protein